MTSPDTCPICRAAADPATGRCLCPSKRAAADKGSEHLLAKAEALFESYLAARVVHARRRVHEAKAALLREPRNRDKAGALRQAEREAGLLEMQLVEQTRKAQQARTAQEAARPRSAAPVGSPTEPAAATAPAPADPRHQRPDPGRTCPRCEARVPAAVSECRCGYSFVLPEPGAEPMLLSEDELLASRRGGAK